MSYASYFYSNKQEQYIRKQILLQNVTAVYILIKVFQSLNGDNKSFLVKKGR